MREDLAEHVVTEHISDDLLAGRALFTLAVPRHPRQRGARCPVQAYILKAVQAPHLLSSATLTHPLEQERVKL